MTKRKSNLKGAKKKAKVVQKPSNLTLQRTIWNNSKLHKIILFIVGAVLYLNTGPHKYAVDDSIAIQRNMFTQRGVAGIPGLLKYDTFFGFFKEKKPLVAGGRYRPLSLVTFAVEMQIFGKAKKDAQGNKILDDEGYVVMTGQPEVSHIINFLLYGLLCVILYQFLMLLFNPSDDAKNLDSYFLGFGTALLFAAHPIHTEAVANIKGRDEIMVLIGGLLSAFWTLKWHYGKDIKYLLYACIALFLGLLSKESAITFLGVIPLSLFVFTKLKVGEIATKMIPLLAVGAVWFIIRSLVLGTEGGLEDTKILEMMNNPFLKYEGNELVPFTSSERFATILYTWGKYLQLLVFPHPLTNDYYPRHIGIMSFSDPLVILSAVANIGLIAYALITLPKKSIVSYGILFYFGTFSVVSNLIFPIGTNMGERFMFIPSIGFCLIAVYFIQKMGLQPAKSYNDMKAPVFIVGAIALLFGVKTIDRNFDWHDDYTLFNADISVSVNSAKLNNAVAGSILDEAAATENALKREVNSSGIISTIALVNVLRSQGIPNVAINTPLTEDLKAKANKAIEADRDQKAKEALTYLDRAIKIHPRYSNAYLLQGNGHYYTKQFDKAIKSYQMAEVYRPDHPDVEQNLAVTYRDWGRYLGEQQNNPAEAVKKLEESVKLKSNDFETFRLLGTGYGILGNHVKAAENFEKALKLNRQHPQLLENLGMAYRLTNNPAKAIQSFNESLGLNSNQPRVIQQLIELYTAAGNQAKVAEMQQKLQSAGN